jgi:hypothetical protein
MISPVSRLSLHGRTKRNENGASKAQVRSDSPPDAALPTAPQARDTLIREAAYRRAEHRGFAPGQELADWLEAEREVDGRPRSG